MTQNVAITGNTYPVKDALKALGARWNADSKAWMVSPDKADAARKIVSGATTSSTKSYRPANRRARREDGHCTCYQCSRGSECLCIYGNG